MAGPRVGCIVWCVLFCALLHGETTQHQLSMSLNVETDDGTYTLSFSLDSESYEKIADEFISSNNLPRDYLQSIKNSMNELAKHQRAVIQSKPVVLNLTFNINGKSVPFELHEDEDLSASAK
jgi:hypothetical protein